MAPKDRKATEAAQKAAEQREVEVAKVEPSGGADGVTVTATDVEEQAAEIRAAENEAFRVRINPALGPGVDVVDVGGKAYREGTRVTQKEFEGLRHAKIGGNQALLKGARA